jgi:putative nucleotidyltransferase with HDIG domain
LPGSAALSVFDQNNQLLYASGNGALSLPKLGTGRSSGELEWQEAGQANIGEYWKLPMKAKFFQDHWTIVASEEKQAALASLASFRHSFPLVILLALWVVLFLSLILIRRTLVPLEKLREGTGKVARGEFETRVAVESRDEFQDLATSFNLMAGRIQTQVRSLKTLNEIDRAILSSWDLDHIVKTLIGRLPDLLSYETVGITVVDFHERKNATTYIAGFRGRLQTLSSEVSTDELSSLDGKTESFVLDGVGLFPQYLLPLVAQGMRQFLVVPVSIGTKLAAVLAFGRSAPQEWDQDDQQQAHRVADQVAVALSNAGLVSQLKEMHWGTLTAFARAVDAKSSWTAGHSERVTSTAVKIGQEMGLPAREIDILHAGGLLHDVGKIGIPAELLDKPAALTADERLQIQEHVLIGVRILKPIRSFEECLPIVREHHEWFDGRGYPYGLKGENISLHGRIFAVADVHDALISDRPYRKGMLPQRVLAMIREGAGTQFDPRVVDAFFHVVARSEADSMEQPQQAVEAGAIR